jgi:hypothetical protein
MQTQQPKDHWLTRIFIATALAAISGMSLVPKAAQAQCNSNDTTAPCFAQNTDILGGQRYLLRNDDLVLNTPTVDINTLTTTVVNQLLFTSNESVMSQSSDTVSTSKCGDCVQLPPGFVPSQMRVGRVFRLPNDVIVTLMAQPFSPYGQFTIQDPQDPNNNSVTLQNQVPSGLTFQAQFALGDFNKDGFQDIFFINQTGADPTTANASIITYTAADLNNPSAGLAGEHLLTLTPAQAPQGAPVVGDFNGDGALDVAWPGATPVNGAALKIYFA